MKDMTLTQEYLVCAVNEKGKIGSMNIEKVVCLLAAGLIWSGVLPVSIAGMSLTIAAGLCALVGGRVAVNRGSGGSLPMGSAAGGLLCLILGLVCLGTTGTEGFHGQFVGILLMTLAGGCLAGLMGKKKRKKKKR